MTDSLTVRRAHVDDAATIAELGTRLFTATFGPSNTAEDLAAYLRDTYGTPHQTRELTDPATNYLLVEDAEKPIGFALVRAGKTPACVSGAAPIELVRFYIDPAWHGRGAAGALMTTVVALAAERGARTLWLAVWERNDRAIAFYRKWRFTDVGAKPFLLGTDLQTDRVMTRPVDSSTS